MPLDKIDRYISRKNAFYLFLSSLCILIVLFAVIIPYMNSLNQLDLKIQNARVELEEQKTIAALYQPLKTHERKNDEKRSFLPMPLKNKLSRKDQEQLLLILRSTAGQCNLEILSMSPDLSALTGNTGIIVNAVLKGDFFNLRRFLIGVGAINYLDQIEDIHIRQQPDKMEFTLKIRFAAI